MQIARVLTQENQIIFEEFLAPLRSSSMFLLANSRNAGFEDSGARLQGTYWGVFEEREMVATAALYWNGNLILQAAPRYAESLAEAVSKFPRPIQGILGPNDQVLAMQSALGISPSQLKLNSKEGLYHLKLEDLTPPQALTDRVVQGRLATLDDLEKNVSWRVGFDCEAIGEKDTPALRDSARVREKAGIESGSTTILEFQGTPVAMSSFNATLPFAKGGPDAPEVVQIGGVWTPRELRGKGYARACVAASLLRVRGRGCTESVLFTGDDNLPAKKAYESLGYRRIGDYRINLLREPHVPPSK